MSELDNLTESELGIIARDTEAAEITAENQSIADYKAGVLESQFWSRQAQLDAQEHQQAKRADIKTEQVRKTAPVISEAMGRVVRPPQDDQQHRHEHSL